jgi:hypothetical protein
MKKIIFTLCLMSSMLSANSQVQESDSVIIWRSQDEFTKDVYYFPSQKIVAKDFAKNRGFSVEPYIDSQFMLKHLIVKMANMGNCVENNEIFFLFNDGSSLSLKSWNKFNCDGDAYFNLSKKDIDALSNKPISKIRVMNGRTFDNMTYELDENERHYFISIIKLVKSKKFVNQEKL